MPDDEAFVDFVRTHADALFRTAYLLSADSGRAEELLQDTLVRLYPQWHRVVAADVPVAYVRRALANAFVSARRRASTRDLTVAEPPDGHVRDFADDIADRHVLWGLLRGLPDRQRAALVLRYFHDMSDRDIADALGCRTATTRSLLSRGIAAMRSAAASDMSPARRSGVDVSGRQTAAGGGVHAHRRGQFDA
jgi:RNA polymerase sigma-70 factor (sigma-E family)